MNLQQELLQEKKEKEELLNRVSLLEKKIDILSGFMHWAKTRIVFLENLTRKLC